MSMVIGKKHIVLASLVVALAVAIFLNYRFSDSSIATSTDIDSSSSSSSSAAVTDTNFFATARLTRSQNRDTAEEVLKNVTSNSSATAEERKTANETINQIAKDINTEGQIETLIKAKGFPECVCLINDKTASVVVKPKTSDSLSANDTAQIFDIVINQTKFPKSSIKIIQQN